MIGGLRAAHGRGIPDPDPRQSPRCLWQCDRHDRRLPPTPETPPTPPTNKNGIVNFLEYALGGDPIGGTTGVDNLPQPGTSATNRLQITLTRTLDRNDITLTAQAADSLNGPWSSLARSTNGSPFTLLAPGATVSETGTGNTRAVTLIDVYPVNSPAHPFRFMRLEVSQ